MEDDRQLRWAEKVAAGGRVLFWALVLEIAIPWAQSLVNDRIYRLGGSTALSIIYNFREFLIAALAMVGLFRLTIAPPQPMGSIVRLHRIATMVLAAGWVAIRLTLVVLIPFGFKLPLGSVLTLVRGAAVALGFAYLSYPFLSMTRPGAARSSLMLATFQLFLTGASSVVGLVFPSWRFFWGFWRLGCTLAAVAVVVWEGILVARMRSAIHPRPPNRLIVWARNLISEVPIPDTSPDAALERSAQRSVRLAMVPVLVCSIASLRPWGISGLFAWVALFRGGWRWEAIPFLLPMSLVSITPILLCCFLGAMILWRRPLGFARWIMIGCYAPFVILAGMTFSFEIAQLSVSTAALAALAIVAAFALVAAARHGGWGAWLYICTAFAAYNAVNWFLRTAWTDRRHDLIEWAGFILYVAASLSLIVICVRGIWPRLRSIGQGVKRPVTVVKPAPTPVQKKVKEDPSRIADADEEEPQQDAEPNRRRRSRARRPSGE